VRECGSQRRAVVAYDYGLLAVVTAIGRIDIAPSLSYRGAVRSLDLRPPPFF